MAGAGDWLKYFHIASVPYDVVDPEKLGDTGDWGKGLYTSPNHPNEWYYYGNENYPGNGTEGQDYPQKVLGFRSKYGYPEGVNIRPIEVSPEANILDTGKPADPNLIEALRNILNTYDTHNGSSFTGRLASNPTNGDVFHALNRFYDGLASFINVPGMGRQDRGSYLLSQLGVHGIHDTTGITPDTRDQTVIFPQALDQYVRNAATKQPRGWVNGPLPPDFSGGYTPSQLPTNPLIFSIQHLLPQLGGYSPSPLLPNESLAPAPPVQPTGGYSSNDWLSALLPR